MKIRHLLLGVALSMLSFASSGRAAVFLTTFKGVVVSGQDNGYLYTPLGRENGLAGKSFQAHYYFENAPGFGLRETSPGYDRIYSSGGTSPINGVSIIIGCYENGIAMNYADFEIKDNAFSFFGNGDPGEFMLRFTSTQIPSLVDKSFSSFVSGSGEFFHDNAGERTYASFLVTSASTRYVSGSIPEPESWLYMMVGFLITGCFIRNYKSIRRARI